MMRVAIILALGFLAVCKAGFLSEEENLFQDDFFSMLESDGETVDEKVEHASKRGNRFLPILRRHLIFFKKVLMGRSKLRHRGRREGQTDR